jgi:hypothetical protein
MKEPEKLTDGHNIFSVPFDYDTELFEATYSFDFYCLNCHCHNERRIRKAIRVDKLSTECDNCGCTVNARR